jgi:hypothetical protein
MVNVALFGAKHKPGPANLSVLCSVSRLHNLPLSESKARDQGGYKGSYLHPLIARHPTACIAPVA